jgi:hypothetical protein
MEEHTIDITSNDVTVAVTVTKDSSIDEQEQAVLSQYAENICTFIRKNEDYGGSFENSAKMESILRHGEVRDEELTDIIAEQILVRGFYDKLMRFHQLKIQGNEPLVDERVQDTLLDLANYAVMLSAMIDRSVTTNGGSDE